MKSRRLRPKRVRGLVLLLCGCAMTPAYVTPSGGPCIQRSRWGKATHYYRNGEPIGLRALEDLIARDPNERIAVRQMANLRRAGWSLAAIGFAEEVAGLGIVLGTSNNDGSLPRWSEGIGGALLANWFPTVLTGIVLESFSISERSDAVNRLNAKGPCPE